MLISYGGIRVGQPQNSPVGGWIFANIRPHEIFPTTRLNWPGSLSDAPILEQTAPPWPAVVIDCLYWPRGASRFAWAHVVVDEERLNQIRNLVYKNKGYQPLPFIIDDGTYSTPVTTKLWMLPARPLSKAAPIKQGGKALYLLSLVDDRYFWWETSLQYTVTAGTTQWSDIYAAIGQALGVSIASDPINANYGTPVAAYTVNYRPTPPVFDAVAWSVGQRVVRRLDGTVRTQNATAALANQATQATIYYPRRRRGGAFDIGTTTPTDLSALVPATVEVVYPIPIDGGFTTDTTTLAELNLPQIPPGLVGGQPWTKVLHRYEPSALHSLTKQVATDWLLWQLADRDQWFVGTAPWLPDGLDDIEWREVNGEITTHIARGVFNPQEDLIPTQNAVDADSIPCIEPPVSQTTVCDMLCVNGMLFKYLQTTFFACTGVSVGECQFDSLQGCCDCDELCSCCTTAGIGLPCPWWLCLWWPPGYCTTGGIKFLGDLSSGESIPLAFDSPCKWLGEADTISFVLSGGTYTLTFLPGNPFGCATYSNNAPWDCTTPYTVYFQSATVGPGCNDCGNWPPSLTLTPFFTLPTDPNPCASGSGSGKGSGSGGGACCDPSCPTPPIWDLAFSLQGCPIPTTGGDCAACSTDTPDEIDVTFSGFSGAYACFNGEWKVFGGQACNWAESTGPGSPTCWFVIDISGVPGNYTWISQLNTGFLDLAIYGGVKSPPFTGDCCSPVTLPLDFATAPGAAGSITIVPVCGGGSTTDVDCACSVTMDKFGCCWSGAIAGIKKPNKGEAILCLVQNADGSLSWVLTVLINSIIVAEYTHNIGTTQPCCCDNITLKRAFTTCAGASPFAHAFPVGADCPHSGSGGHPWWCVSIDKGDNIACGTPGSIICVNQGDFRFPDNVYSVGEVAVLEVGGGIECEVTIVQGPFSENTCGGGCQSGSGSGGIGQSCCPSGVPSVLHMTLNGGGVGEPCHCLNGTYALTFDPAPGHWTITTTLCGRTVRFDLSCINDVALCGPPNPWLLTATDIGTGLTTSVCGPLDCTAFTGTFSFFGAIQGVCNNVDFTPVIAMIMP